MEPAKTLCVVCEVGSGYVCSHVVQPLALRTIVTLRIDQLIGRWVACVDTASSSKRHSTPAVSARLNVLLGDIGATNARFAALKDGRLSEVTSFAVANFRTFDEALRAFLDKDHSQTNFTHALLALAGPIELGRCRLTNTSWTVDPRELSRSFGFEIQIVNDFQAVAYSLPALAPADLRAVGGGKPR